MGPCPRHRAPHRTGSRTRRRTPHPGPGRHPRRLPWTRRGGHLRAHRRGSRRRVPGRPAGGLPRPLPMTGKQVRPVADLTRKPAFPDSEAFVRDTEPLRRELLAHCYRMLGSVDDATDVVQETYLRAWRSYGAFEGRSSVRTWLYQIATNACLTALGHHSRRVLPSGLGGPESDPEAAPEPAGPGIRWLQPVPDVLVGPDPADPASIVLAREDLRLALVASLQYLSGTQRAVLI